MFRLDMHSIRQSAEQQRLTANLAKPANLAILDKLSNLDNLANLAKEAKNQPEISQKPPKLARLAGIAISHDVSQQSAKLLAARLIAAAMRVCDHHGDGEKARADMRADCLALDQVLQADLLEHFRQNYPASHTRGAT